MYILDARSITCCKTWGKGKTAHGETTSVRNSCAGERAYQLSRFVIWSTGAGAEWTWCVELRPDSYDGHLMLFSSYVQSYYSSTTSTTMTRLVSDITSVVLHQSVVITS